MSVGNRKNIARGGTKRPSLAVSLSLLWLWLWRGCGCDAPVAAVLCESSENQLYIYCSARYFLFILFCLFSIGLLLLVAACGVRREARRRRGRRPRKKGSPEAQAWLPVSTLSLLLLE
jgi:hypothetical protein